MMPPHLAWTASGMERLTSASEDDGSSTDWAYSITPRLTLGTVLVSNSQKCDTTPEEYFTIPQKEEERNVCIKIAKLREPVIHIQQQFYSDLSTLFLSYLYERSN